MTLNGDNNNLQIFQTPNTVAIYHEQIHEALIIPLDGRPHLPAHIRMWKGDARGHWEGDTLVVETVHRHQQWMFTETDLFPPNPNMRVTERFRRVDANTLSYHFTVDDPETFTAPWSAAWPMRRTSARIYEYACHEGNRTMPLILAGARAQEAAAKETSR